MRILYFTQRWPQNSATFITRELKALRGRGHDVRIVSTHGPGLAAEVEEGDSALVEELPHLSVYPERALDSGVSLSSATLNSVRLCLRSPRRIPSVLVSAEQSRKGWRWAIGYAGAAQRVFDWLGNWRPEVAHAMFIDSGLKLALVYQQLARRVSVTGCAGGSDILIHGKEEDIRFIGSASDALFAPSLEIADVLRRMGIQGDKVLILQNAIPIERYVYDPKIKDPRLVLSVGRLHPVKGYETLIDAISILRDRSPHLGLQVLIAGDGEQRSLLDCRIRRHRLEGVVRLVGRMDAGALIEMYSRASIFILTSVSEGLPNVLLEAGASGCSIIATRVGGVPDVIVHRTNGLLIPKEDPGAAAEALEVLLSNEEKRKRLGIAARETVCLRYSSEVRITRLEELWRDVVSSRANIGT